MTVPAPAKPTRPMSWWAVEYTQRLGWSVFPIHEIAQPASSSAPAKCSCQEGSRCSSAGKHPRVNRGFLSASDDPETVRRWWKRWPKANIGIATGASGLVVLDVDPRNGGDDSLAELEKSHGQLPHTITQLTGGGGVHYLFAAPPDVTVQSGVLADGLDIKSGGGYIVATPSNHASGRDYAWDAGALPSETPLAPAPEWMLARLEIGRQQGPATDSPPIEGLLGAAFHEAGWLGWTIRPGVAVARCPWEDEHTTGKRYDSSTVVWGPNPGKTTGAFWCLHSHCQHSRTLKDVLAALPPAAVAAARQRLGLPSDQRPVAQNAPGPVPEEATWLESLTHTEKGRIQRTAGNAVLLATNLPPLYHVLAHDTFSEKYFWDRPVPKIDGYPTPIPGAPLGESDWAYLQQYLSRYCNVIFARDALDAAIIAAAKLNGRNPLREYLQGLRWDGRERIERWLVSYLGVEECPYSCVVGRWWLLSLVARALSPGCQADHVLVLEGPQGTRKTSALRVLGGEWFLGRLPDVRKKDASQALTGKWLVEISELEAIRGAESSAVKDYLSQKEDDFRPPYARNFVKRPRMCAFAATTNDAEYLHDPTGGRRFWPVRCGDIDVNRLADDRDQLFAETVARFCDGDQWWPQREYESLLQSEQADRTEQDSWTEQVVPWVAGRVSGATTRQVLIECLNVEVGRITRNQETRVGSILRRAGFAVERRQLDGVRQRFYVWPTIVDGQTLLGTES